MNYDDQTDRAAAVDGELRSAVADLDTRLMSRAPGSFAPSNNAAQPLLVAAVALVLVGLAVWMRSGVEDASEVTTVTQPTVVGVVESIPTEPGPSTPAPAARLVPAPSTTRPARPESAQPPSRESASRETTSTTVPYESAPSTSAVIASTATTAVPSEPAGATSTSVLSGSSPTRTEKVPSSPAPSESAPNPSQSSPVPSGPSALEPNSPADLPTPSATTDTIDLSKLVQSAKPILRKPLQRPNRGVTITDPAFGTQMTRLTASTAGESTTPLAASVSAWNADESLLLLYRTGVNRAVHQLHDGATGAFISELPIVPADIEQFYWSPVDAKLLYYTDGARFMVYDVVAGRAATVHTFAGCDNVDMGSAPVAPSADGRLWGFVCHGETRNQLISYELDTDEEHRIAASGDVNAAPSPTPAGDGFVIVDPTGSSRLTDDTLATSSTVRPAIEGSNFKMVRDTAGRTLAVGPVYDGQPSGTAVAQRLTDGVTNVLVGPDRNFPYPPLGTQLVVGGARQPSLAVVSVQGDAADGRSTVLDGEILLIDAATTDTYLITLPTVK